MMNARHLVTMGSITLLALAAVGCSQAASSPPASSSPGLTVLEQVAATATGVEDAVAAYESGETEKAIESATDAYLEHFEFVEGPLEAVDEELTEMLEDKIRDDLRALMTDGAPAADVRALGTEILDLLDQASTRLE